LIHYFILTSFFWTNVMAWDIYKTFGKKTVISRVRNKSHFAGYAAYALGVPFLIVAAALLVEYSGLIPGFDIGYGEYLCWISNAMASGIFLGLPMALVLATNVIISVKIIYFLKFLRLFKA